jgi:DNA (cytosine-5)-methyltransferase 1
MRQQTDVRRERPLKTVGLFAGIGGFELGLAKAGHELTCLCEIDHAARAVLTKRFDGIQIKEDIRLISYLGRQTELVTAGFPCQDLSQAGQTKGVRGKKSGIVAHVFRLLKQTRVPWVLLENVPFMLKLDRGAAIRRITSQLESLGYSWAYRTIDSRAFGLPQRRERVFLLAALDEEPWRKLYQDSARPLESERPDYPPCGFYWTEGNRGIGWAPNAVPTLKGGSGLGIPSPPAIWLRDGSIVTLNLRDAERLQGFSADWTKPAQAVGGEGVRWRLVGNAVTTNVSKWLGTLLADGYAAQPDKTRSLSKHDPWPPAAMGYKGERYEVLVSTWPARRRTKAIDEFIHYEPRPLSLKAASGFWQRLKASNLSYPPAFAQALQAHIRSWGH